MKKGIEKVQSFNKKSVAEVQKEIKAIQEKREEEKQVLLQQQEQQEQEEQENEEKSYKELFHNSLIIGDSIAEGFLDGGFLDPIHVRTDRGKSVYHMEEQLELVRSFAPENIFLIYGMNDVLLYEGDTSLFRERYREFLEQLQQVDPDAKIYINLIFPVQQRILKEKPAFQHIDAFNQVLIDLGKEMNIPVLGVVENMSYVESNSGEKIYVFGKSNTEEIIKEFGLKLLARIPLKENTSFKVDQGLVEEVKLDEIERIKDYLISSLEGEK